MKLTTAINAGELPASAKRHASAGDLHAALLSRNGVCPRCEAAPAGSAGVCVFCYVMSQTDEAPPIVAARRTGLIN